MNRHNICALFVAAIFLLPSASADTLLIEGLNRSQSSAAERPNRGMKMEAVEAAWGAPESKRPAVGDPPITRWEYPGFVVYFEYAHVIHAVAK